MPYKVMIVDDEPIIRFGISSCVDWEQEGLTLIGQAANGETALDMIKNEAVDILITDIRMPLMDGLELTRQVKKFLPHVKVILISSYSDFEFAREALTLGVVVDYLLKPTMEPTDLIRILHNCRQRLDEEVQRDRKEELFEHEEYRHRMLQFESKLKSYLSGATVQIDWKPDWLLGRLVVAIWKHDASDVHTDLPRLVLLESVKDQLNSWSAQGISLVTGNDEIVTLHAEHNGSAVTALNSYHKRIVGNGGPSFTMGISPAIHSFAKVLDALEWAASSVEAAFFHGRGQCYQGVIPTRKGNESDDGHDGLQKLRTLREQFSKSFAASDRQLSMEIVELCIAEWRNGSYKRQDIILEARNLIVISTHQFKHHTEETMASLMSKLMTVEHAPTLDSLVAYIHKELRRLWEPDQFVITPDDVGGTHIIQLALSYIQDHYRREISLQEVADYVHMSKNYFSEQFKKRTGYNFIDFVIRLRIHYAKHLLETTSLRIHDIGVQSGFNSPKHFLKIFKRMTHATPNEYRDQVARKQQEDDRAKEHK